MRQQFPQWVTGDDVYCLYQPEGGLVDAALGNSVHVQLARANGASVRENCTVMRLEPKDNDQCVVSIKLFRNNKTVVTQTSLW